MSNKDKVQQAYPFSYCRKEKVIRGGNYYLIIDGEPKHPRRLACEETEAKAWRAAKENLLDIPVKEFES